MKKYTIVNEYVTFGDLADCEERCVDSKLRDKIWDDILTELMARRAFHDLSYKDGLLMEDLFRKGFAAAHITLREDEE